MASSTRTVMYSEYYNDPAENTNLLGDANSANNPPASTITALTNQLNAFATCTGPVRVKHPRRTISFGA